jgi:hypothetical protein
MTPWISPSTDKDPMKCECGNESFRVWRGWDLDDGELERTTDKLECTSCGKEY